jgi:hypothetical protein
MSSDFALNLLKMLVIDDLLTAFCIKFLAVFMICFHTNFHTNGYKVLLVIATKPEAK